MAGLGATEILKNVSALEQLLEEINFQRAKEMRQCLLSKDSDTGFVMVHGTTYWTDLFVRHFLFQTDRSTDCDDLLFFIRKKHVRGSRYVPKYKTEVEVYRKDSRKLPIGDPDIDWEETVYLNLIIHQFDYTLTLAICTRTSPKDLQILRRHSQKVYASPSRRRMDTKGEVEEITYPNVCFHVDNFDEVFSDMQIRDGEMVCVELVASDHSGNRQAVLFLGSIRYDALKKVYDARASLSSKVAQRMMLGLFSGTSSQRIEFVRMKGPQSKGHAELAVTKPKGSGVETPTSEPGVSMTDLWDTDWEDEPQDMLMYRHQRRLSDPSANFNTFMNSGWRAKPGCEGGSGRSRSENEGLDSFADGLYEIESGDVRDACSCQCCNVSCGGASVEKDEQSPGNKCPECQHFHCTKVDEDPVVVEPSSNVKILNEDLDDSVIPDVEIKQQSSSKDNVKSNSLEIEDIEKSKAEPMELKPLMSTDEEVPDVDVMPGTSSFAKTISENCINTSGTLIDHPLKKVKSLEEKSDLQNDLSTQVDSSEHSLKRSLTLPKSFKKPGTAVRIPTTNIRKKKMKLCTTGERVFYRDLPMTVSVNEEDESDVERVENPNLNPLLKTKTEKVKRKVSIPWRKTPNGTTINFLSDIKLDDGAYNPLWSTRGFTQTFHFWKENKRAQSVPLNAYLTYITLPWYSIISDILDHETGPILTF